MLVFNRVLQNQSTNKEIISRSQKGFKFVLFLCWEYIFAASGPISDAQRWHRSICMMTRDFRNAFGSVPHELIFSNIEQIGCNQRIQKLIYSLYANSIASVLTGSIVTSQIQVGKGVRYGCLMSPAIFDVTLEPLLRRSEEIPQMVRYSIYEKNGEACFNPVHTCADNIIIISNMERGIDPMLMS